jgi:hypothetical protein
MDPKGYLRRGRKSMNLIPEGFALKVVSPVYLLIRYSWCYPTETSKVHSQHRLRREPKGRLEFVAPRASST